MVHIKTAFLIGFEFETEIRQRKSMVSVCYGLGRIYQRANVVCEQHGESRSVSASRLTGRLCAACEGPPLIDNTKLSWELFRSRGRKRQNLWQRLARRIEVYKQGLRGMRRKV